MVDPWHNISCNTRCLVPSCCFFWFLGLPTLSIALRKHTLYSAWDRTSWRCHTCSKNPSREATYCNIYCVHVEQRKLSV
ncbi:hypothetical protein F4859DRAFT_461206 [Xylaria cf. heliscus]|nr:hypothetical protein F4859DRAFT_461206 [Xylaria cf. heliscus]